MAKRSDEMTFDEWVTWVQEGAHEKGNHAVQKHCRTIRSNQEVVARAIRMRVDNPPGSAVHMAACLILDAAAGEAVSRV
jgi:hypothetical protein